MSDFEPGKYITKVNGGDYLEIKWRLVWLRNNHPDADIETEFVRHFDSERLAIFKAHVSIPGRGSATGWGSESADDFRDYIEKAETKALGRALAALGFGTQFTDEYADAAEGRIADAPIDISRTRGSRGSGGSSSVATPKQIKFLRAIAREAGLTDDELEARSQELFSQSVDVLPRRDASALIEQLQQQRVAMANVSDQPAPAQTTIGGSQAFITEERATSIKATAHAAKFNLSGALRKRGLERLGQLTNEQADALLKEIADYQKQGDELAKVGAEVQ